MWSGLDTASINYIHARASISFLFQTLTFYKSCALCINEALWTLTMYTLFPFIPVLHYTVRLRWLFAEGSCVCSVSMTGIVAVHRKTQLWFLIWTRSRCSGNHCSCFFFLKREIGLVVNCGRHRATWVHVGWAAAPAWPPPAFTLNQINSSWQRWLVVDNPPHHNEIKWFTFWLFASTFNVCTLISQSAPKHQNERIGLSYEKKGEDSPKRLRHKCPLCC